ncbi:PP2C family protein-serine/threonine phosphatase [Micromonospora rifamycinica]|uniref:Serine phosphatase RsbU, regulator of sigma subunit n=1 Tax=Micromonospora rifamycinica TaxID=291594 RepID=A0A109IG98_9ACTN|nr:PP2C family protein-serine/threonine phosphatase [Micromonospora rifamycinica]KWV30015.1 serine/threonine protein phosphatase [Micromonospora rifamycinica]SCG65572.1 Serine phosphatase RsbU, regulator of sigma subunit [Micromonospora rifamycinica]
MEDSEQAVLAEMLQSAEDAAPVEAVEAVTGAIAATLHALGVSLLVADLSGRALVRLTHQPSTDGPGRLQGDESAEVLPFDGGPYEQAVRQQAVRVLPGDGRWRLLAPVTERGEAIGLLEIDLPDEPDAGVIARVTRTAHTLAFVVIANRRHTDLFEWGQRSTPFTLSAEIQRRLLPAAFTCEAGAFTLSGWLEPAASVGGDTFDYSVDRDLLHVGVTDAMGHGVASALTATLGVGSLRNTRRRGLGLVEQADEANRAIAEHANVRGAYVTAVLGRIDLPTGRCELLNAGHVPPMLVRDGRTTTLDLPGNFPLGMFPEAGFRSGEVLLRPGDRLVVVTDGMRERNAADLDLPAALLDIAGLHPREAVRALSDAVLSIAGPVLADDATLLIVDWYDGHGPRRSTAGADTSRASAPPR